MEKSKMNRVLLMTPIFAGVIGFLAALLFAPRSGKQSRERLVKEVEHLKKQTQDNLISAKASLKKNASDAADFKNQLIEAWKTPNHPAEKKDDDQPTNYENLKQPTHERNSVLSTWEEEG